MKHDPLAPGPDSTTVRSRLRDEHRQRVVGQGLTSFLGASGAWMLTLIGIAFAPWWAKVPLGVLNGITIGVMFIVAHDACHGALLPKRWMNRLSGRISLLPALHPFIAWVHNHNGLHHGFTNIKERDPGFPPLSPSEYHASSRFHRWRYRVSRKWYGLGLLYFCEMWLKWEVLPNLARAPRNRKAYRTDRLMVLGFAMAWMGFLIAAADGMDDSAIGLMLVGFVLPQFIWNWLIGFIILQQHTHPRVPWYSERDLPAPSYYQAQIRATPHLFFPGPFRFLLRNVMEHTVHHADPSVPLYQLLDAQTTLAKAYRRDMVRVIWTRQGFLKTLRICRLYDYETHRWVDYDGTPLTERLIPEREAVAV